MKIAIVGAGPVGLLLAQHLVQRPSYDVHLFDNHAHSSKTSRSYPICLHGRGVQALQDIPDLPGEWLETVQFHMPGQKTPQTIARPAPCLVMEQADLVNCLWEHLESCGDVTMGGGVSHYFAHNDTIVTHENCYETFDGIVACDGSHSIVRTCLADQVDDFCVDDQPVTGGYRPLFLQQHGNNVHDIQVERGHVHGWMTGTHNLLAVPLSSHPESCSGVWAYTCDTDPLMNFDTPSQVQDYFDEHLPDVAPLLSPEEAAALLHRPARPLHTVQCSSLTCQNRVVLLGDAAHTYSSTLNQGCNAGLEDVRILVRLLNATADNWSLALQRYNAERLPVVNAGHVLSNYAMPTTSKLLKAEFMGRMVLRKVLPSFLSKRLPFLPSELIHRADLSYQDILDQCEWWTTRVQRAAEKEQQRQQQKMIS